MLFVGTAISVWPLSDVVAIAMSATPHRKADAGQTETGRIQATEDSRQQALDPLNATYTIEGQTISLHTGRSEISISPDSATKIKTTALGNPTAGDLDADGDPDAAVLLVHDPGGSGTFYYIAAALNTNGRYHGTHAALLGDRIAPRGVTIRDGIVEVSYSDRPSDAPMSSHPSVEKKSYLTFDNGTLRALNPLGPGEWIFRGWVTIGHEMRTLGSCSLKQVLWLSGDSPALKEIIARYRETLPGAKPYTPLFMVLAGRVVDPPQYGFGADYEVSFLAAQLVSVRPKGNCRSQFIVVDLPAPGGMVASPLLVRGRARGNWFFEGDFPVRLEDLGGNVIARGYAAAKGQWMTKEFVPFEGTLEFNQRPQTHGGMVIFTKDNPSDRRELDDELRIPVFFE